jgi:hypothetical protein
MHCTFNLSTPLLFLCFNRLDPTKQVFEAIRQAKPPRLYVAADGPRSDRLGEAEKVKLVRDYVLDHVDWKCEVKTLFRENNLGCRVAVSSAIDWFFENEAMGIILEDDCLPHPTFFRFCEELLELYRNDTRVMQICGSNFLKKEKNASESYYFSKYGPIWGWASWRRAWKYYDVEMKLWETIKQRNIYYNFWDTKDEILTRVDLYNRVVSGEINTWDYQWGFAKNINSGLSITPNVNLISNIGFGEDGTHVTNPQSPLANLAISSMEFPLSHPFAIYRDSKSDKMYFENNFKVSKLSKLKSALRKYLNF